MGIIGLLALQVMFVTMSGLSIKYAWNTVIVNIFELPQLVLWQAIGIDMLITFITGYADNREEKNKGNFVYTVTYWAINNFILVAGTYILTFFM